MNDFVADDGIRTHFIVALQQSMPTAECMRLAIYLQIIH